VNVPVPVNVNDSRLITFGGGLESATRRACWDDELSRMLGIWGLRGDAQHCGRRLAASAKRVGTEAVESDDLNGVAGDGRKKELVLFRGPLIPPLRRAPPSLW